MLSPAASFPRQRGPRTDAQRNDQRILRAAARVLAEDPRASIQRIADEAGGIVGSHHTSLRAVSGLTWISSGPRWRACC